MQISHCQWEPKKVNKMFPKKKKVIKSVKTVILNTIWTIWKNTITLRMTGNVKYYFETTDRKSDGLKIE